ncbi:DUF87 domain-containing protein [Streptomyces sp. V4-01]|uniref:DUF87 domain-containing protein n=1 Tax=Actinacidiphila polyblastidii TaxID=3110430 RepID=A0ABU7PK97_9ACTN|nr:DUF87 domain-containing protein [Streptomyces sp. V4-01]
MPGVLLTRGGGAVTAWVGVRVDAAADLTETREYADLSEQERLVKAAAAEAAWLAGQWEHARRARVELRYRNDPATQRISCALLGRVTAPSEPEAVTAALALRARLARTPRHVQATEITAAGELGAWLDPFDPHPAGLADIRKRIRLGRPNRPDAGVDHYLAVQPYTAAAPSWEPLWQALAVHPEQVLLAVGLAPYHDGGELGIALHELATAYGRLAAPGRQPDGLWSQGADLAPEAFAIDAARWYSDAARRYPARSFRTRVTLASPAPLTDALTQLVASVMSPPERATEDSERSPALNGPAHIVIRPVGEEAGIARHNLVTLDQRRWDTAYLRDLPQPPPAVIRLTAELADTREAGAILRFPLAVHGHVPGFPVRRPGMALESAYTPTGPHLVLGRQLVDDRPTGPLGIELPALTRHTLLVGTTGSGKTNTSLNLCEQLWRDHRIPFLVLEPVNTTLDDYRWLATRPGMEDLLVLTAGDESIAPLRLNPFAVPHGVRISGHIAALLACFDAAFGLWDPLPAIYNRALRAAYARRGIVTTDISAPRHDGNWPTLSDFVTRMREATGNLDYSGEVRSNIIAASRLRAESLAEGACASTLDCTHSYPVDQLLRRPVVIELAGVGDNEKEQSLLTALLLQTMTEHYKATRPGGALAHVTVIEEAHRLLGKPVTGGDAKEGNAQARAAQAFANTLAENRKYGEALLIVEQVPGKLVEDAYKNTNLKIMHRLPAEDDRTVVGSAMRFSDDQKRYAATLTPFTAFAHHDALDRPALIQVPDIRADAARTAGIPRAPLATDTELRRRFHTLTTTEATIDQALAPFPECDGCAHRCQFRSRAATIVTDEHALALRERISRYPEGAEDRGPWWAEITAFIREAAAPLAPHEATMAGTADYEACVFVHTSRAAYRNEILPWVQRFRRHAQDRKAPQ